MRNTADLVERCKCEKHHRFIISRGLNSGPPPVPSKTSSQFGTRVPPHKFPHKTIFAFWVLAGTSSLGLDPRPSTLDVTSVAVVAVVPPCPFIQSALML